MKTSSMCGRSLFSQIRWDDTDFAICLVPRAGVEPARLATPGFEAGVSTGSTTGAYGVTAFEATLEARTT